MKFNRRQFFASLLGPFLSKIGYRAKPTAFTLDELNAAYESAMAGTLEDVVFATSPVFDRIIVAGDPSKPPILYRSKTNSAMDREGWYGV